MQSAQEPAWLSYTAERDVIQKDRFGFFVGKERGISSRKMVIKNDPWDFLFLHHVGCGDFFTRNLESNDWG